MRLPLLSNSCLQNNLHEGTKPARHEGCEGLMALASSFSCLQMLCVPYDGAQ